MEGKGSLNLPAGIEQSWDVLLDSEVLKRCIMGCKKLELVEENKYEADISMGVASVKGDYSTTIELANINKPISYQMIVKGEGGPGSIEAVADITLESVDENNTVLSYSFEAEVGGKVAMVGQRMLGGVSKLVIKDFFKKFGKELKKAEVTN
ncbi:carbon monoxide dehydrogenase subunit G [Peribacillus simplex]|nr:carbon monoxide dehydrogenase subunit G [Peribacillus frigoritolerans]MBX9955137.1 carbon monoxide dehydrogenase subunit G [Peribacillus simplex]PAK37679.1 carbon monoxide dehydrogenase [Peribacillus simplex]PKF86666.1 carbon monoxide dehydrogenase [Bacillus sp. BA3]